MKYRRVIIGMMLALAVASSLTSCKEKEYRTFGSQMDQFSAMEPDGKVYLGHAEQWLYWEPDDQITVAVGSSTATCELVSGEKTHHAYFHSDSPLPTGGNVYAFYPHTLNPQGSGSSWRITIPDEQAYRNTSNATATDPDSSFGRGALPMVCWNDGTDATGGEELIFHVVCGVLRVQLFTSSASTEKEIESIEFEEVSNNPPAGTAGTVKQLAGNFDVHDIQYNQPWLTAAGSASDNKVTITDINKTIGPDKLLTFYLPLPALGESTGSTPDPVAANTKTHYWLKMTITASDGTQCVKTISADIHRRNLTMMPALRVDGWATSGNGTASGSLVGSGTKDRPFQIYTDRELLMVRNAINNSQTINGQTIRGTDTEDPLGPTCFKIMRSDIVLTSDNWTEGFRNFKGYMTMSSTLAYGATITNNSRAPLFESIATNGKVELVYVGGSQTVSGEGYYSPFCYTNQGVMVDCHNRCAVTNSTGRSLAGLCAFNEGTIIGGANEAPLTTTGHVAGVVGENRANAVLQGTFSLSAAIPTGTNISGICYRNYGLVQDCQVSANVAEVTSSGTWGLVVFENLSTGVIDNCIANATVVFSVDGSLGGICNQNAGTIKGCSCGITLLSGSGSTGGIVAVMTGGEVYNCLTTGANPIRGADNAGGIVGYLQGGTVANCYNTRTVETATNSGGIIGRLAADATVINCWNSNSKKFAGVFEEGAAVGNYCFNYETPEAGCNRFTTSGWTLLATLDAAAKAPGVAAEQALYAALNVGLANAEGLNGNSKYYTWQAGTGSRPSFVIPMSVKRRK